MKNDKKYADIIDGFIDGYHICEFYHLQPEDLIYSDRVRTICEEGCPHYNKSWACPPAIENVTACALKCHTYGHIFLFTSVAEVSDCMNFSACLEAKSGHESLTRALKRKFEEHFGAVLALSTGCMLCEECTYPNKACRHPEERLSTIESHGILIMETARRLGVTYDCGNNIVTYFSLIFFNTQ